jgi:predicted nuclease of predicted toxin-antitoxin system
VRLRDSALLTDENVHPDVAAFLREQGHDVLDVKDASLAGLGDTELIRLAFAQGRVVVTHDSDFGKLAMAAGEPMVGVLYLRPGHIVPSFTIGTLKAVAERDPEFTPPFIVVAARSGDVVRIRVRQL